MPLGIGNSLIRNGGGLSGDGLALDLQFAADKTLTARKGPTPVLTRSSTGTFVGSNGLIQSAANNVARFDHDPVTLACNGLLIEESRTNLSLYSGVLSINTGWAGNATSSVSETGPDGNASYKISESTATGIHNIANTGGTGFVQVTPVTSGTTYTGSIFVKKVAGSIDWIQLTFGLSGFGAAQYANFNIGTGTVGNYAGLASGTVPRIEAYGDDWYRLSISATASARIATNNVIVAFIQNTNGTTRLPSYAGSTANAVLATLCQFEAGSFATSYIPTTTSALARSADVCSISGSDFTGMYNNLAGTIFCEHTLNGAGAVNTTSTAFIGVEQNGIQMNDYQNILSGFINSDERSSFNSSMSGSSFGVLRKSSMAFQNDGSAILCQNGTLGVQDDTIILPSDDTGGQTPTALGLFRSQFSTVKSFRYFKKRLPNAKLQSITA